MSFLSRKHSHNRQQPQHGHVEYQQYSSMVERPVEDYCGGGYRTENTSIMTDYNTPPNHRHHGVRHGHGEAVYKHSESFEGEGYYGGGGRHSNHLGRIQDNCEEDVVEDVEIIKRKQFVY